MARVNLWETQRGRRAKVIGTYNGAEYLVGEWARWLAANGIVHQTPPAAPYTPQQNGVAERYNRVMKEQVLALLADGKLHAKWWAEPAVTVNYLANRVPHRGCTTTPYEAFHAARPDVSHIRVFGCRAWAYTPGDIRHKLQPRSKLGIFLGYGIDKPGYRILFDGKVTVRRDVYFDEDTPRTAAPPVPATGKAPTARPDAHFPDEYDSPGAATPATRTPGAVGGAAPIADAVAAAQRLVLPGTTANSLGGGADREEADSSSGSETSAGESHADVA